MKSSFTDDQSRPKTLFFNQRDKEDPCEPAHKAKSGFFQLS